MQTGDTVIISKYGNGFRVNLDPKWVDREDRVEGESREWDLVYVTSDIDGVLADIRAELERD